MADAWLTTLITATPQEGFELAVTLSRRGVKYTQPDVTVLKDVRFVMKGGQVFKHVTAE